MTKSSCREDGCNCLRATYTKIVLYINLNSLLCTRPHDECVPPEAISARILFHPLITAACWYGQSLADRPLSKWEIYHLLKYKKRKFTPHPTPCRLPPPPPPLPWDARILPLRVKTILAPFLAMLTS
jgi:hypothetical protein